MNVWIILPALAALAAVYVLMPVALTTYSRYRRQLNLRCPVTGEEAGLYFEPGRAALSSCWGRPSLSVRNCSLWPARRDCARVCARLPENAMREARRLEVA
jgi:hypothetical protein